jgi:hypothetical protein
VSLFRNGLRGRMKVRERVLGSIILFEQMDGAGLSEGSDAEGKKSEKRNWVNNLMIAYGGFCDAGMREGTSSLLLIICPRYKSIF